MAPAGMQVWFRTFLYLVQTHSQTSSPYHGTYWRCECSFCRWRSQLHDSQMHWESGQTIPGIWHSTPLLWRSATHRDKQQSYFGKTVLEYSGGLIVMRTIQYIVKHFDTLNFSNMSKKKAGTVRYMQVKVVNRMDHATCSNVSISSLIHRPRWRLEKLAYDRKSGLMEVSFRTAGAYDQRS